MFPRYQIIGLLVSLALMIGLLGACGPKPPPQVGEIKVEPSTTILVGESASLTITASGTGLQFNWTASRGSLSDPTAPSVLYTAPDSPGPDTVTVEVISKGGRTIRSITFEIATLPTPTPTPTATPTRTPTPAPTEMPSPTPTLISGTIDESGIYCTSNGGGGTEILAVEPPRPVARFCIDMKGRATIHGDSLWEVEVYGPDTGDRNLVIDGRAEASSEQDDENCSGCFAAEEAIDGDMTTRWSSDWYDPQWLEVTLPDPQVVNRIVLKWETAYASEYCATVTQPTICPYQADTDEATITQLIQAEAQAVNLESICIIRAIFAEDAVIRDVVSVEEWHDPVARYEKLFAETDFTNLTHFDILPAGSGISGMVAYYTSGNEGDYRVGEGEWQHLYNGSTLDRVGPATQYGSDHWTLGRNSAGCWEITEFTFNAGHDPFPP